MIRGDTITEIANITKLLDDSMDISQMLYSWNILIKDHIIPIYRTTFNAMKFVVKIHNYLIKTLNFKYELGHWNIGKVLLAITLIPSSRALIKYNCSCLAILIIMICDYFSLFHNYLLAGFVETHMFIVSKNGKWIFETTRPTSKWRSSDYIFKSLDLDQKRDSYLTTSDIKGLFSNYAYSGLVRIKKNYKHAKYIINKYPLPCPEHIFYSMRVHAKFGTEEHEKYLHELILFIKDNRLTSSYIFMIYNVLVLLLSGIDRINDTVKHNSNTLTNYQLVIQDLRQIIEKALLSNPNNKNIITANFLLIRLLSDTNLE